MFTFPFDKILKRSILLVAKTSGWFVFVPKFKKLLRVSIPTFPVIVPLLICKTG